MNNYIVLIVLISILQLSQCQVPGFGRCPAVSIQQNFDVVRYMGRWYENRKYPFIFQLGGRCVTADYTLMADSSVKVVNTQVRNNAADSVTGSATLVKPGVGSLTVTFPEAPFTSEGNYNVLYTDYESLAVVYSCTGFLGILNAKSVWILTRQQFPNTAVIEKALEVLRDNDVSTAFLSVTNQRDCPGTAPTHAQWR